MILFAVLRRRKYPIPGRSWIIGGVLLVILYLPWIFLGIPDALAFRFSAPAAQISSIFFGWHYLAVGCTRILLHQTPLQLLV
jgi:hypothetical protein